MGGLKQKFVIRLMSADHEMLGWCEEHLVGMKGSFRATVSDILLTHAGVATYIQVHWCDLDVIRTEPLLTGATEIPADKVGTVAKFGWTFKSVWLVEGARKDHLEPVVVTKNVVLSPDVAQLGAIGQG